MGTHAHVSPVFEFLFHWVDKVLHTHTVPKQRRGEEGWGQGRELAGGGGARGRGEDLLRTSLCSSIRSASYKRESRRGEAKKRAKRVGPAKEASVGHGEVKATRT